MRVGTREGDRCCRLTTRSNHRRYQHDETNQSALHATIHRFAEDAMTPSRKPVALVTGANKGIGFEVARGIAKAG